jgi:glycosyltransferase involved in cell wall biosynthesis
MSDAITEFRSPGRARPRTAVLIPCFNAEDYLPRALASLRANDEPHDVVLVDDGSRSPIAATIGSDASNVVVLRLERNVGITAALNAGLKFIADEGYEYVARLDADDWSTPDRLRKQVAFLDAHPACVLVGTWYRTVDTAGRELFDVCPRSDAAALRRELAYRNCFAHSGFAIRVSKVTGYDASFNKAEDYELILRLERQGAVAMLPELLTFVQVTPGSISSARLSQIVADLRVKARYFDPLSLHSYFGVLKTVASAAFPRSLLIVLRARLPAANTVPAK